MENADATSDISNDLHVTLTDEEYQFNKTLLRKINRKEIQFFKSSIGLPNNIDLNKGISFGIIHKLVVDMYTQHSKRKFKSLDRTFELPCYPTYDGSPLGQATGRLPVSTVFITSDMEFAQKLQSFFINLKRGDVEPNIINLKEDYQHKAVYPLLLNLFKNGEQHTHSLPSLTGVHLKIKLDYIRYISQRLLDNGLEHSMPSQPINMPEWMKNMVNYCNASWFVGYVSPTHKALDLNIMPPGIGINSLFFLKKNNKTGQYCVPLLSHDKEFITRCENLIEAICFYPEDAIEQFLSTQLRVENADRFLDFYSTKKHRDILLEDINKRSGITRKKNVSLKPKV